MNCSPLSDEEFCWVFVLCFCSSKLVLSCTRKLLLFGTFCLILFGRKVYFFYSKMGYIGWERAVLITVFVVSGRLDIYKYLGSWFASCPGFRLPVFSLGLHTGMLDVSYHWSCLSVLCCLLVFGCFIRLIFGFDIWKWDGLRMLLRSWFVHKLRLCNLLSRLVYGLPATGHASCCPTLSKMLTYPGFCVIWVWGFKTRLHKCTGFTIIGPKKFPGLRFCSVYCSFAPFFGLGFYYAPSSAQFVLKLLKAQSDCNGFFFSSGPYRTKGPPHIYRFYGHNLGIAWLLIEGPLMGGFLCYVVFWLFCMLWARVNVFGRKDIIPTILLINSRCSMFSVFVVITKACFGDTCLGWRGYAPLNL